jgi:hypothetical protein
MFIVFMNCAHLLRKKTSSQGMSGMNAPVAKVQKENTAAFKGAVPPVSSGSMPSSNLQSSNSINYEY